MELPQATEPCMCGENASKPAHPCPAAIAGGEPDFECTCCTFCTAACEADVADDDDR